MRAVGEDKRVLETVRAFIALELPDEARRLLSVIQDGLRRGGAGAPVRWVEPGSIHLTLKFLGDVPAERVEAVTAALARATLGTSPFTLATGDLGVFPPRGVPRVVWVGLTGRVDRLSQLQASVEREVAPLGFPAEARVFSPHLTLGRVREGTPADAARGLGQATAQTSPPGSVAIPVVEVVLMRSRPQPGGSVYTPLARSAL